MMLQLQGLRAATSSKIAEGQDCFEMVPSNEADGRSANKVVLYEDAAKKQLQEFISAPRGCELVAQACSSLAVILENVESGRLHHLLTPEANNSGRIIPHEGVHVEYDSACEKVKEVESSLARHLKEQQKLLGDTSITYVTVGKEAYVLEVPEHLRGSIPQDYELRSSKKGFYRYWTPSIKKFLGELSQVESDKESALKSILQRVHLSQMTLVLGVLVVPALSFLVVLTLVENLLFFGEFVWLSVILAQIGVDAPAESFELSPVNRIFVRMGAKDHIMAVQSTFLTELSETALVLVSFLGNFEAFLLIERVTVPMTVPVYRRG
uniref:Uncharacterized protein n=1 Tax=Populus alba TaxID=43335 RepID=A0A4U5QRE1_POPAL|nr:hypothetical protein D5086_0000065930 [Populus alba]